MLLRLTKIEEIETIIKISIDTFYSDYLIGMDHNDGLPGYDSLERHQKMQLESPLNNARANSFYGVIQTMLILTKFQYDNYF